jgi:hypothetical protein
MCKGEDVMAMVIDLVDLEEEDARLVKALVKRLRRKAEKVKSRDVKTKEEEVIETEDVLDVTAGSWKDTIDCEELKRTIIQSRLNATRSRVEL